MTAANIIIRPATVVLSALALVALLLATAVGRAADDSPSSSIKVLSPSAGQTVAGNITWEVEATGKGPQVQQVEFFIDGVLKWREQYEPYVFNGDGQTLDTTTLANGPHELKAVATDEKGRLRAATVTVTVANVAPLPQVSIPEPRDGATLSGTVKWMANVSGPSPQRVEFLIDGVLKWTEQFAAYGYGGDAGLLDTTTLANGSHSLKNVAYAADGRSTSASVTVAVSNGSTAPPPTPVAPKSLSLPTISGTPMVGSTLSATLGTWSGTAPIEYTQQWERCGSTCASIAGATALNYAAAAADVGYKLRVTVKATNSAGTASTTSSQTAPVTSTTAPPPTSSRSFTGWDPSLRPGFTARRTITVTSRSAFDSAWAGIQPGDKIVVSGFTFNGQVNFWNRMLSDWAEIHFADDVRFVGGGQHAYPAVSVADVAKIRFYGGDVTNPTGAGIKLEDASDINWWGFRVHDTAGTGFFATGVSKAADRLDLRGEVWHCGLDLSLDPHTEKGTGNHAVYLAGNSYRTSGTFIFKVHDQPYGAAIQIGSRLQDSIIELDARRITFQAQIQVGGNALQWWGDNLRNVRVPYVYGEDLVGRVSETDGLYNGSNPAGAIQIEYGRSGGFIRLSPKYATTSDGSVRCLDCQ